MRNLREIRGIGPSVAEKLIAAFGSEKSVLKALRESRIAEISSIEGIGERFSLTLCRNLHYQETGEKIQNFLKTEESIHLYDRIARIISQFSNTSYSRSKLYLHFPLPISAFNKIKDRQRMTQKALHLLSLIKKSPNSIRDYDSLLRHISPLKELHTQIDTASRVVITTDKNTYEELKANEIGNHCEIILLEEPDHVSEYVEGYDEIIWIGSSVLIDEGFPNIVTISETHRNDIIQIIPEKVLSYFARNKRTLESIANLAKLLSNIPLEEVKLFIDDLKLEQLIGLGENLVNLEESGEPVQNLNEEYSRLLSAEANFETKLNEILVILNEELENKLQDTTVHLGGEKILALLKGFAEEEQNYSVETRRSDLREYLDNDLFLTVEEIINKAEEKLIRELELKNDELDYITGILPRELRFPVEVNEEISQRMKTYIRQKRAISAFDLKVSLAKTLRNYESVTKIALNRMFELDYLLMIGKFARKFNLVLPQLIEGQVTGLLVEEGRNLFLAKQENEGVLEVSPVSYAVGEVGKIDNIVRGERIILLSGANSGGKTTLLVSLAIMVILSQMGFPIPCKSAIIGGFKELHYYRKSAGQMDAGAFETTLRSLSKMIMSPNARIVLADEMESISEPGASARVIAAFLDLLARSPHSVGIFVTHLAQEIAKYSRETIRIDGIEAHGLSEDLELIVNRTPKYYKYAKSTPELIVRRLQRISTGEEKEIYSYILKAFETN